MKMRLPSFIASLFCFFIIMPVLCYADTATGATDVCTANLSTYNNNGSFDSSAAFKIALTDNAVAGQCAKGVANILAAEGYPDVDALRGDAYTWPDKLLANGWVLVTGVTPENAPAGAINVYSNNNPPGTSGGAKYGHVEIVAYDSNGNRQYVSDAARSNAGGTVPQNYVGTYVFVGKK